MAAIAKQTLGFVRDGSKSPAPVKVTEAIAEILRLYKRKLQDKALQVEAECDSSVTIQAYEREVRQLLSNLLINAVEATPHRGRIRIHAVRAREWSNGQRRGVRITVADTGGGIADRDLAHIFEPFYTTKKGIGTGLGLWLCHGIVEQHDGWIRVRSSVEPGRSGTVFAVFLPESREARK